MSIWRHARAIVLLPGTVTGIVPGVLAWQYGVHLGWWSTIGAVLVADGLAFFVWTLRTFVRQGRGTLAPWDPTQRLVIEGPYRYVRNPMITAVLAILAGEAVILGSAAIGVWAAAFFLMNAVYFPLSEEPGLEARFGADYEQYKQNVPRWIPRVHPWPPKDGTAEEAR